ncbi:hypothetical protein [Aminivibrio sp.]|uniref:hypothetical protein n=1 Tax=Aminivibrio sp. TaxID=1872489 RepID=UPI00345ECFA7
MTEKRQNQQIQKQEEMKPAQPEAVWQEYDEDEISLGDLFSTIWRARGRIAVYTLAAGLVILAIIVGVYFFQEKEYVVKQEFRLEFTGADQNKYPNGLQFSTADILSTEVLDKVYRQNDLGKYMKFSDFKAGLAVFQMNDRLRLLEFEYSQRFSEKNLSMENRQRLEQEFLEKKKALMVPVYSLTFIQGGRAGSIPDNVAAKVLQDILREWSVFAERVKGANKFQLELVSPNVLKKEDIEAEDYLVATDILRVMTQRVSKDLEALAGLPGAMVVRVGDQGISLSDLRYRLQDLERFKLNPLLGLIRQTAVSKHPEFTLGYLQNQIFDLKLKTEQAAANVAIYENSLNQYIQKSRGSGLSPAQGEGMPGPSSQQGMFSNVPAMIPQFGESFLDSLVQMAQENSDAMFRQNITKNVIDVGLEKVELEFQARFYEDMWTKINLQINGEQAKSDNDAAFLTLAAERIEKTQQEIFDGLMNSIKDLNLLYDSLSRSSLNPDAVLYSVTSPALFSVEKPVSAKRLVMFAVLGMFLCVGVILLTVLVKGSGRGRERTA